MPAVLTSFWNWHKKLKKKWKTFTLCHYMWPSFQKNKKIEMRKIFKKSVLRNELSCMKIHGFQGKWPMVWPHSWYRLFKWYHIVNKGAYWNGKQFFKRGFSFSVRKKIIFHFTSAKIQFFMKNLPNLCCKIAPHHVKKILDHILCTID